MPYWYISYHLTTESPLPYPPIAGSATSFSKNVADGNHYWKKPSNLIMIT